MDLHLLEKFFDNRCSPEEAAEVLRWFERAENKTQTLAKLETYWRTYRPDEDLPEFTPAAQRLRALHRRMARRTSTSVSHRSPHPRPPLLSVPQYLRVAAIVAFAIVGSMVLSRVLPVATPTVTTVAKTTLPGQRNTFRLPAGTQVILNADSEIRYSSNYGESQRNIHLTGEAFFEVAHDPSRPFTVTAHGVATTALGTSFNVRAYEPAVEVALVTGKVRVAKADTSRSWVLTPGERLYYPPNAPPQHGRYDTLQSLAWKDGTLHFSGASLSEVIRRLERWYGVSIELRRPEGQPWNYTGTFVRENLENVLTGISYAQDFDFTINDKQVILTFKPE